MKSLYIMKGVSCSGKSTYAKMLSEKTGAIIISSDAISLENNQSIKKRNGSFVFQIMEERARKFLKSGESIIIDATNLSKKRTTFWSLVGHSCGADVICVFLNPSDDLLTSNIKKRAEGIWKPLGLKKTKAIVSSQRTALNVPSICDKYERIIYVQDGIIPVNQKWIEYISESTNEILTNPGMFFENLAKTGALREILPELADTYGFKQENTHHTLTVFGHMMASAEHASLKTPEIIWALLLHDIGKVYPGIKSLIVRLSEKYGDFRKGEPYHGKKIDGKYYINGVEIPNNIVLCDNEYHYYQHQNLSAQLSCHALKRVGFNYTFIEHVSSLIQHHMALPYSEKPSKKLEEYLSPLMDELKVIRNADIAGK